MTYPSGPRSDGYRNLSSHGCTCCLGYRNETWNWHTPSRETILQSHDESDAYAHHHVHRHYPGREQKDNNLRGVVYCADRSSMNLWAFVAELSWTIWRTYVRSAQQSDLHSFQIPTVWNRGRLCRRRRAVDPDQGVDGTCGNPSQGNFRQNLQCGWRTMCVTFPMCPTRWLNFDAWVISITAHVGIINAILGVVGRQNYELPIGGILILFAFPTWTWLLDRYSSCRYKSSHSYDVTRPVASFVPLYVA